MFLVLARTIYIRCMYGIFGRKFTKYTVIYGVYIRSWPTLVMFLVLARTTYAYVVRTEYLAGRLVGMRSYVV